MPKSIAEAKSESNGLARLVLVYGVLEKISRSLVDESERTAGDLIQDFEDHFGSNLMKDVNFALGVRNRVCHGDDVPANQIHKAAEHLLEGCYTLVEYLDEDGKAKFLGSEYRPPKKKKRKKRGKRQGKKPPRVTVPSNVPRLLAILPNGKQDSITELLDQLNAEGFEVQELRRLPRSSAIARQIKKIGGRVASATSPTSLANKAHAMEQISATVNKSIDAYAELRIILDVYLIKCGRDPRTAEFIQPRDREERAMSVDRKPNYSRRKKGSKNLSLIGRLIAWFDSK